MANRIYPVEVPNPVGGLGLDKNSDWRPAYIDKQSDGDWAIRTSLPPDRIMSDVSLSVEAQYGNHSLTTRGTYTVPSGSRAILLFVTGSIDVPGTTGVAEIRVRINNRICFWLKVPNGAVTKDTVFHLPLHVWLKNGDVVTLQTGNTSTSTLWYVTAAYIVQFDA